MTASPHGGVTASPPRIPAAKKVQKKVHRNVAPKKRVYNKVSSTELEDDGPSFQVGKRSG